jgi:peroxiredoxin
MAKACRGPRSDFDNSLNSTASFNFTNLFLPDFAQRISGKSAILPPPDPRYNDGMSRLKPILFFVVVAAVALFFVLRKPASAEVNVGDPAPEFAIKDETGKELKLSDYRGNVVFLNFWYTTCEPCRQEMPDMELVNRVFKDRKFKMIPVSVDTSFDDVKKFYQDFKLTTMGMYLDPGKQIANRYNVYKFPETYVIDGNGIVLKHYIGGKAWSGVTYMNTLEDFVRKQETPTSASQ